MSISLSTIVRGLSALAKNPTARAGTGIGLSLITGALAGKFVVDARQTRKALQYGQRNLKQRNASLADIADLATIDPVGIYSSDLRDFEEMDEIMQMALNIFTSYILRAIPFLAEETGRQAISVLQQLKPGLGFSLEEIRTDVNLLEASHYTFGLPSELTLNEEAVRTNDSLIGDKKVTMSSEAKKSENKKPKRNRLSASASGLKDFDDLAVGKLLEIDIPIGGKKEDKVEVKVQVTLTNRLTPYEVIKAAASGGAPDKTWLERWIKFRAGSLGIASLVTQGDVISENIKNSIKDKSGLLAELNSRKSRGLIATAFGGKVSYGIGSNVTIISLSALERLEKELRFDVMDFKQRQSIMSSLSTLIFIVVDKEDSFLTIFYRNLRLPSEISLRALARLNKKSSGPDIGDMLRQLANNSTPQF